ncbi:hypothetical protein [Spirosoma sp.]|uniref:hypothetical protein n=1 Tax=Spirosoma sp. TaxID=1899569 RepID=UPI003B3B8ACE
MKLTRFCQYLLVGSLLTFGQCKRSEPAPALDDTVDVLKSWKAAEVKEGTTVVYKADAQSNIYAGYAKYKLLFAADKVTYTEFTGEVFTGSWSVDTGTRKLTFHSLSPVPYGTDGLIEFELLGWQPEQLIIRRTTGNVKTGNTVNEYTLVPE